MKILVSFLFMISLPLQAQAEEQMQEPANNQQQVKVQTLDKEQSARQEKLLMDSCVKGAETKFKEFVEAKKITEDKLPTLLEKAREKCRCIAENSELKIALTALTQPPEDPNQQNNASSTETFQEVLTRVKNKCLE